MALYKGGSGTLTLNNGNASMPNYYDGPTVITNGVVKPGHGRALSDSHAELPVVEDRRAALDGSDFASFRALADMPWAMTAHVLYNAIDPDHPATTSPRVIGEIIRGHIGFKGVLISDDLSMQALEGDLPSRARAALDAGCDLVLHCTGEIEEMQVIADGLGPLSTAAHERLARARGMLPQRPRPFDVAAARRRLARIGNTRLIDNLLVL